MSFDTFLCHNSNDKPLTLVLAESLKEKGIKVWLDEWEIPPGRQFQNILEELIEQVRSVAILVGGNGIGPWQESEMRGFLEETKSRGIPLIPVLLPGAPLAVRLPLFLRAFAWVDCRDGFTAAQIERLVWGITGIKPKHGDPVATKKMLSKEEAKIDFELISKNGKVPFRLLNKGGKRHFNLRIFIAAEPRVLSKVTQVEYLLHKTFKQPRRVSADGENRFAITIWTYGCFEVHATIYFEDGTTLETKRMLNLILPNDGESAYIDVTKRPP